MIRTLLTTVAALALTVAIAGCGDKKDENGGDGATKEGDTTAQKTKRSAPGSNLSASQDTDGS